MPPKFKKVTKADKQLFLNALRGTGHVKEAARVSQIGLTVWYRIKAEGGKFSDEWDEIGGINQRVAARKRGIKQVGVSREEQREQRSRVIIDTTSPAAMFTLGIKGT